MTSTGVAAATRHSARLTVAASVSPAGSPRLSPRLARRPAVPAVVKVGDRQEPRAPPPPPQLSSSSSREGATPAPGFQFDTETLQQALRTKMSAASATPVTPFFRKKQDRSARPCSEEARRARNRCFQSKKREETRNKIAQLEHDVGSASAENRALRQKIAVMQARWLRAQPPYAQISATSAPSSAAQSEGGTPPGVGGGGSPPREPSLSAIPAASHAIDIPRLASRGTAGDGIFADRGLGFGAPDLGLGFSPAAGVPGSLPAAAPQWQTALPAATVDGNGRGSDGQSPATTAQSWPPYLKVEHVEQPQPLGSDSGSDFSSNKDLCPGGPCVGAPSMPKGWLSAIEMELTATDLAIDIGGLSPALDALSFDIGDVVPTPFVL